MNTFNEWWWFLNFIFVISHILSPVSSFLGGQAFKIRDQTLFSSAVLNSSRPTQKAIWKKKWTFNSLDKLKWLKWRSCGLFVGEMEQVEFRWGIKASQIITGVPPSYLASARRHARSELRNKWKKSMKCKESPGTDNLLPFVFLVELMSRVRFCSHLCIFSRRSPLKTRSKKNVLKFMNVCFKNANCRSVSPRFHLNGIIQRAPESVEKLQLLSAAESCSDTSGPAGFKAHSQTLNKHGLT